MKIICIGKNYAEHTKEVNNKLLSEPIFFLKPDSALLRNNNPFYIPQWTNNVHYEVELVLRICRLGKCIEKKYAHRYYNQIGIGIDFTARDIQEQLKQKGLPWEKAKAFDQAAAISKNFLPTTSIPDVNNINFSLNINNNIVQKGNSKSMLYDFDEIISYISKFMTLKIGDLIFTGTPAGAGPVKIGDQLVAIIENEELLNFSIK